MRKARYENLVPLTIARAGTAEEHVRCGNSLLVINNFN